MNLQNDTAITETVPENNVVETTSTEVAPKKVYDTPYKTRGQWFKEMRESGQLAPRQPKTAEVAAETVAA